VGGFLGQSETVLCTWRACTDVQGYCSMRTELQRGNSVCRVLWLSSAPPGHGVLQSGDVLSSGSRVNVIRSSPVSPPTLSISYGRKILSGEQFARCLSCHPNDYLICADHRPYMYVRRVQRDKGVRGRSCQVAYVITIFTRSFSFSS